MKQFVGCFVVALFTAACGQGDSPYFLAHSAQPLMLIGGVPAAPHEYPAVGVLLTEFADRTIDDNFCTATLIAPDLILTAAHCSLNEEDGGGLLFSLQRNVRANLGHRAPRNAVYVDYFLTHEELFDEGFRLQHDVAVGHLSQPIDSVAPYAMLSPQEAHVLDAGPPVDLVGYGYFHFMEGADSSAFHGVKLKGSAPVRALEPGLISVGDPGGPVMACFGDSGGPALVQTLAGPRIAGVVSAQRVDPEAAYVGLCTGATWYTSVPDHADWIAAAVARLQ